MRDGVAFSISLPIDVADFLDDYAERHKMKRSHVVAKALTEMQRVTQYDCCGECYISEPGATPVSRCGCPDLCGMNGCTATGKAL